MKTIAITTFMSAALALFVQGACAAEFTMRTSTNQAASQTTGQALQRFVDLVNERSQGRIEATANFGSELGSQSEQVEMCRIGALEMVQASPGTGPGAWVPEFLMFEFPYLVIDNDHYVRVIKAMTDEVSRRVEPYGFIAMEGQSMGIRQILTKKPVTKLADLKNLKMRGPNAIYVDMFEKLGASGTTMDWNEIYTALQTGVIDGLEASPSMLHAMRFEDEAPYMAISNHVDACLYYFFNKDWYNSLPDDLRAIVNECAAESTAYQEELEKTSQQKALDEMVQNGMTVTELTDLDEWRKACAPMLEEYRAKGENFNSFIDMMLAIE